MPTKKKKSDEQPLVVGAHTVQVFEIRGALRLLVDGVRRRHVEAPNGFTLREAIYERPLPTLLEAGVRLAEQLEARDAAAAEIEGD